VSINFGFTFQPKFSCHLSAHGSLKNTEITIWSEQGLSATDSGQGSQSCGRKEKSNLTHIYV